MNGPANSVVVCALYRFVRFADFAAFRAPLLQLMRQQQVHGTLLLAAEGINGTIAGSQQGIDAVLAWLAQDPRFAGLETRQSRAAQNPFYRTRVKLKSEIVTMGVTDIDPNQSAGTYVAPKDWNDLISDPEVLLLDTRNQYEVQIGTFTGAVNPGTTCFREFPDFVAQHLDPARHRQVAMFCTGGIRCEKSTAYLKQQGFEQVYHLQGGILNYLQQVPRAQSRWQGECFVFDNRVTVNHELQPGSYDQCHACRMPITAQDKQSEQYRQGVSCPHCHQRRSPQQLGRYRERQRQMTLARQRGEPHIGSAMAQTREDRRRAKLRGKQLQRQADTAGAARS